MIRGLAVLLLLLLNLAFWGVGVLAAAAAKLLLPSRRARAATVHFVEWVAGRWIDGNHFLFDRFLPVQWEIEELEGLGRGSRYLIIANHTSWVDIVAILQAFHGRIPLIRFFLKHRLIWLPIIGQACWALEFPFLKRYSEEYLARHPEKRGTDLATARRACERYRELPISVLLFVEGTRFSEAKRRAQQSPYRHLLLPRVGGAAWVMATLGDQLDGVLDVTLVYPGGPPTFWQFLCGRVERVEVHMRLLPVPDPSGDLRPWIDALWEEKDALIYETFRIS